MKLNLKWRKHYLKLAWDGYWYGLWYSLSDLWMAIKGHNPEKKLDD